MDWLSAPGYWLSALLYQRGVAALYVVAFVVTFNQFPALLGERGLEPVPRFLGLVSFRDAPSLFHWRYSDGLLRAVAVLGALLAAATVLGLPQAGPAWVTVVVWLVLWMLYQSVVNVGQTFYGFGWETLLLEAGFFAIFLGPGGIAPPFLGILMIRWLLFRTEFGAGLIKMRGDPCWRDLTCLYYHHETQPMPNPLSWLFHNLPKRMHRVEVAGNHVTQLLLPFGLFFPQPVAGICALVMIATQLWLVLSGNFSWLNWVTIVLAVTGLDDGMLCHVIPVSPPALQSAPAWFDGLVVWAALGTLLLSWWPVRNMLSRRQRMNTSFNALHLVGSYGAFGSITRVRNEIVIEGCADRFPSPASEWRAYEFRGKPGNPRRLPPQVAPYHLRLDWLMWFAAMSSPSQHPWFVELLLKLLDADRPTLRLLRRDPFGGDKPAVVRALLYRYHFTTWSERRKSGEWWKRRLIGEYLPPLRLRTDGSVEVVRDAFADLRRSV